MATISPSDLAPAEAVHYSLAGEGGEFDLDLGDSYETDNAEVIRNALAHPWLKVEVAVVEPADEEVVVAIEVPHTAIESGLDQKDNTFVGGEDQVAVTVAADDAQGDEPVIVDDPEIKE